MQVKVLDYNNSEFYIVYEVSEINENELEYLYSNLNEKELNKTDNKLNFKIGFEKDLYPFQSEDSQLKVDDYIKREEIEMKYYLTSFLEDMN